MDPRSSRGGSRRRRGARRGYSRRRSTAADDRADALAERRSGNEQNVGTSARCRPQAARAAGDGRAHGARRVGRRAADRRQTRRNGPAPDGPGDPVRKRRGAGAVVREVLRAAARAVRRRAKVLRQRAAPARPPSRPSALSRRSFGQGVATFSEEDAASTRRGRKHDRTRTRPLLAESSDDPALGISARRAAGGAATRRTDGGHPRRKRSDRPFR